MKILKLVKKKFKLRLRKKGGAGSGNWGHAGRPGMVGGSGGSGIRFGAGSVGDFDPNHPSRQKATDLLNKNLHDAVSGSPRTWQHAGSTTRGNIKREIINELAERTGVAPDDVRDFIEQWAHSSNNTDMRSLAIQKDAAAELGLALSEWQQGKIDIASSIGLSRERQPLLHSDTQRQLIRAMYDNTQEQLAAQGFKPDDTVRLYRGVVVDADWTFGDVVNYQGNTIESWSVGRDIAKQFASSENGYILEMDIPARNIVGTARSGFGCLTEGEYIVAGTVPNQQAKIRAQNVSTTDVTFMWSKSGG